MSNQSERLKQGNQELLDELQQLEATYRRALAHRSLPPLSAEQFIRTQCRIFDPGTAESGGGSWLPFDLWPAQAEALGSLTVFRLLIWLKARQLGMSQLARAWILYRILYAPGSSVLVYSYRDDESIAFLDFLKSMYEQLPAQFRLPVVKSNAHVWELANGSVVRAFPPTAGDSYTASLAVIDEADLVPNLTKLLGRVKPTIDAGGQLLMLSRSNKDDAESAFKKMYRAARAAQIESGKSPWHPLFWPWHARPDRTPAWYEEQRQHSIDVTTCLDLLHEQYPATENEALAPRSLDKRLPAVWLDECYRDQKPLVNPGGPAIAQLLVWKQPEQGRRYIVAIDPAEGNPTSDESGLCVLDDAGEQVAELAGLFQPAVIAAHADRIALWYNRAGILCERNNHGHAVLLWLRDNSQMRRLKGHDAKEGWLSSSRGKDILYDKTAEAVREREVVIHSFTTYSQLASIEGATLRAPEGLLDDRADAFALGTVGLPQANPGPWKLETF